MRGDFSNEVRICDWPECTNDAKALMKWGVELPYKAICFKHYEEFHSIGITRLMRIDWQSPRRRALEGERGLITSPPSPSPSTK